MTAEQPRYDRRALTDDQRLLAEDIASAMPDRHDETCGVWQDAGDGCTCPLLMAVADGLDAARVVAIEVEMGYDSTTHRGDRVVRRPFSPMSSAIEAEAARPPSEFRGDAMDRLAERDRFLRSHGGHGLRWVEGDEEFGTFDGLVCDVHEDELQLIPPAEGARPLPEPQPLREALRAYFGEGLSDREYDAIVDIVGALPDRPEPALNVLRALAGVSGPAPHRVQRCVTHHGCECREWANETLYQFRDAARSLLPVDEWGLSQPPVPATAPTCPRCAHRPHEPGECSARYFVNDSASDPCLCEVEPPVGGWPDPATAHEEER